MTVIGYALLPARIPFSLGFDGQWSLSRDCAGNESGLQFPALSAEGAVGEVGSDTCDGRFLLSAKNAAGELGSETGACPVRPHLAVLLSSPAIWRFPASTDSSASSSARKPSRLETASALALHTSGRLCCPEYYPPFQRPEFENAKMARRAPSHYRAGTAGGQHLLVHSVDVRRKDCSVLSHAR